MLLDCICPNHIFQTNKSQQHVIENSMLLGVRFNMCMEELLLDPSQPYFDCLKFAQILMYL